MEGTSEAALDRAVKGPIFFEPNPVERTYRGGLLLGRLLGDGRADGYCAEEWIASEVASLGRPDRPNEGISRPKGLGIDFARLIAARRTAMLGPCRGGALEGRARTELGLLVKILDSAQRLSVQVHPDAAFASERFGSPHGKMEMWLVLEVRPGASLFVGFTEGATRAGLSAAMDACTSADAARAPAAGAALATGDEIVAMLNEAPAVPGEAWLIPGRLAHAIGAGCLVLEVQEPTDLVFRAEAWSGERRLTDREMYGGLDKEAALDCFDFDAPRGARAIEAYRLRPRPFGAAGGAAGEIILGKEACPYFSVNRYRLGAGHTLRLKPGPAVMVATRGEGLVGSGEASRRIRHGEGFFLPAAASGVWVGTLGGLELVECLPAP